MAVSWVVLSLAGYKPQAKGLQRSLGGFMPPWCGAGQGSTATEGEADVERETEELAALVLSVVQRLGRLQLVAYLSAGVLGCCMSL